MVSGVGCLPKLWSSRVIALISIMRKVISSQTLKAWEYVFGLFRDGYIYPLLGGFFC